MSGLTSGCGPRDVPDSQLSAQVVRDTIPDPDSGETFRLTPRPNPLKQRVIGIRRNGEYLRWGTKALRLSALKNDAFFSRLPPITIEWLSEDPQRFNRLRGVWLAIEDALHLAVPEARQGDPVFQKLEKWVYTTGASRSVGPDGPSIQWKAFVSWAKHSMLASKTPAPAIPRGFPFFDEKSRFRGFRGAFSVLNPILQGGVRTKGECTRMLHLCTTRGLPAASKTRMQDALRRHYEVITSHSGVTPERVEQAFFLARRVGRRVRDRIDSEKGFFKSAGHVSVTTSASAESSMRMGGRAAYLSASFLHWMLERGECDKDGTTILGVPYVERKGVPRWRVMCHDKPQPILRECDHSPAHQPLDCPNNEWSASYWLNPYEDPEADFVYDNPLQGVNDRIGHQLHQWAFEEGVNTGVIRSPLYGEPEELLNSVLHRIPSVNRCAIGEPGCKARIVTCGEAWLTIFLQPFGHQMVDLLSRLPQARAGLSAAYQGYEWVKSAAVKGKALDSCSDLRFLTSDLETATDYCDHAVASALLRGFVEGVGFYKNHPYIELAIKLLCSPRKVMPEGTVSSRGVLMGDPGCKSVLTLFNLVAEEEAYLRYTYKIPDSEYVNEYLSMPPITAPWRHFACAGDDHAAVGPDAYVRWITRAHSANGMCVKWESNFVSELGLLYCEEMIASLPGTVFDVGLLWEADYLKTKHIDALKVRLLSPYRKENLGTPSDSEVTNPAVGKSSVFLKKLDWLPTGWSSVRGVALHRFRCRMHAYLPNPSLAWQYLPRYLGGLAMPYEDRVGQAFWVDLVDPIHQAAIQLLVNGEADFMVRRALARFASNDAVRGVDVSNVPAETEVRSLLRLKSVFTFEDDALTDEQIRIQSGLSVDEWSRLRTRERDRYAQRGGYVSLENALRRIERPYIFTELLRGNINPSERRFDLRPWEYRYRKFLEDLKTVGVPDAPSATFDASGTATLTALNTARNVYVPLSRLSPKIATFNAEIYRADAREYASERLVN
uniref:RNA-dependent RNA polymerase n=1 Tax=Blattella germanica narna-like virus 1 TaxID=3133484 RepID=A0AAT9JG85_9VIRU